MHKLSINFISFTAQIFYNALHMQGKKERLWHLGGAWPPRPP